MRIKTFQGRSLEELLPEIRAELGAGAVVIGQRTKVEGGVAGFFGTRVIEVTAADSMPSDDQLVDLEGQMMGGGADAGTGDGDPEEAALAARFAGAMRMGRRGGVDVTDEWDPSQDAELAQEYGRVLEHAAASGGFSELEVPVVERPAAAAAAAATATVSAPAAPPADPRDPMAQARALAERTHAQVHQATTSMDDAVYAPQMTATAPTYAPPRAMPHTTPVEERARTFAASVLDTPMQGYDPAAVPADASAATTVDHVLRTDLGLGAAPGTHADDVAQALDAAVDMIDLKAMAALRNAVQASRRLQEHAPAAASVLMDANTELELGRITELLARAGVDDDVILALSDAALRHRMPFGGEQRIGPLMRELVEEAIDVRSGFPKLGRAYRMALVGASSCGKSTVAAKIACSYRATGLQVGILSIIDADPSLAVMGDSRFNGLDVDVRYAGTPEQAAQASHAFASHDLVIIDTPGSTYLSAGTYEQVRACLAAIGVDDVHVVLPLATSSREARALVDAFRPLGANRMVISRLDESRYIGQLLNFGFRLGVPMTFLSEGPRIPEDLRAASARAIADRILPA